MSLSATRTRQLGATGPHRMGQDWQVRQSARAANERADAEGWTWERLSLTHKIRGAPAGPHSEKSGRRRGDVLIAIDGLLVRIRRVTREGLQSQRQFRAQASGPQVIRPFCVLPEKHHNILWLLALHARPGESVSTSKKGCLASTAGRVRGSLCCVWPLRRTMEEEITQSALRDHGD